MDDDTAAEGKPDPQIHFNGKTYDLAMIRDFTLDEHRVLWDFTGMSADKVIQLDDVHPGVLAATLYVSVARAEPTVRPKQLRAAIGKLTQEELLEVLADMIEDDEEVGDESVPPPSEPEPEPQRDLPNNVSGPGSEPTGATVLAVIEGSGSGHQPSPITAASENETSATVTDQAAG